MDVSSDGNTVATGENEGGLGLWDIRSRSLVSFLQAHNMGINDVKIRGNLLLTASSDTCLKACIFYVVTFLFF